jgi:type III pantothenate kinase
VINIGNSHTVIACIDRALMRCLHSRCIETRQAPARLHTEVERMSLRCEKRFDGTVTICSVCRSQHLQSSVLLAIEGVSHVQWVGYTPGCGITLPYADPYVFGADRFANLLYARHVYPDRHAVIIDAGTAVNVDCLEATGTYAGGAILPGYALQSKALAEGTDALAQVRPLQPPASFPALSTQACIDTGIRHAIAGGLERMVARRLQVWPGAVVLACGGGWESVAGQVSFSFHHVPQLTLVGCALFAHHA